MIDHADAGGCVAAGCAAGAVAGDDPAGECRQWAAACWVGFNRWAGEELVAGGGTGSGPVKAFAGRICGTDGVGKAGISVTVASVGGFTIIGVAAGDASVTDQGAVSVAGAEAPVDIVTRG